MENDAVPVSAQVDAAAASLGIPLTGERRSAVVEAMTRLRAFAADIAAVDLGGDGETNGAIAS